MAEPRSLEYKPSPEESLVSSRANLERLLRMAFSTLAGSEEELNKLLMRVLNFIDTAETPEELNTILVSISDPLIIHGIQQGDVLRALNIYYENRARTV